ncbi:MAG: outer membrane lipoprotein-sorting protein [Deltaproteobacteria bacterium]|nr:outer membrane lipoprotein-sorting protein [Deltaproteobacteria bacterium]
MFRRSFLVFILLLFAFAVWAGDKPSADAIVAKADDAARRDSSFAAITMRIQTPRWNRELSMKAWTQGRDKSFIVVEKPAKDAGTTFLKLDHEMWQYIPRIERKVKIPPSMMLQSWMGSDFTNEDLSRDDAMITDYTHQVAGEETVDGLGVWLVESTPKESAAVFWGQSRVGDREGRGDFPATGILRRRHEAREGDDV